MTIDDDVYCTTYQKIYVCDVLFVVSVCVVWCVENILYRICWLLDFFGGLDGPFFLFCFIRTIGATDFLISYLISFFLSKFFVSLSNITNFISTFCFSSS